MTRLAFRALGLNMRLVARVAAAGFGGLVLCSAAPDTARAQFSFFGQGGASAQDVYDTIAAHGFRLAGPMIQNGDVYVADVFDRRQRRERLIVSRSNAQIIQRFFVEVGPRRGQDYASTAPRASAPAEEDGNFFSRLTRGWGDESPVPRPPGTVNANIDGDAARLPLPDAPRAIRPVRPRQTDIEPRVATRRDDAPVIAKPLPVPAPSAAPLDPAPVAKTEPASPAVTPPAGSPPPARATVVSTDPLRIPGQRGAEPDPVGKPNAKPAVVAKPVTKTDVPVAPLD